MSSSTNKKVLVVRFDREPVTGYVAPATSLQPDHVEVLTADGAVFRIPYADVKLVKFVKSWDTAEAGRKEFASRPKTAGLWVQFDFRDGASLQALLPNRLNEFEPLGFWGTPPDAGGNTQRVFVPRAALSGCTVLGVIGGSRKPTGRKRPAAVGQLKMFD